MSKLPNRATPLLLALALLAAALPGAAQTPDDTSNSLTAEQVACNETQLRNLLSRLNLNNSADSSRDFTLFVTYSNPFGFYEGLAVANQDPLTANNAAGVKPESFLAFHLNPSVRSFLLNPNRTPLDQISLEREESASNLVGLGSPDALVVTLNPTLGSTGGDAALQINNFRAANGQACGSAIALSTKPGRGLAAAGLLNNCHTQFTNFDRTVFALIERMLRIEIQPPANGDAKVAVYRGEDPFTYRVDIYPVNQNGNATFGKVALELTVETDSQGNLGAGLIRVLPACTGGSTTACSSSDTPMRIYLFPPVFGGTEVRLSSDASAVITYQPGTSSNAVPVSFSTLLNGTAWNQ